MNKKYQWKNNNKKHQLELEKEIPEEYSYEYEQEIPMEE